MGTVAFVNWARVLPVFCYNEHMKRKWDVSSREVRKKCVDEIIARIDEQQGLEFGRLAAEEIIDIVAQDLGTDIYNLAIDDAKKLLQSRFSDLETDVDLLEHLR